METATVMPKQPSGLAMLNQLISSPPRHITTEELCQQGLSKEDADLVLDLGTKLSAAYQRLALYETEAGQALLQKQQESQVKLYEQLQVSQAKQLEQMMASGAETMKLTSELKRSLIDNASGTLGAFQRVIHIYTAAFVMGILLMITAVVFAAMDKTILAIAFGTIGLIDMMTYFFKMPASEIQVSRSNLSQLQVVLLAWLKDFVNNDALTAKLINADQPQIADYKALAEANIDNTAKLLQLIQDLAEPKEKQS